MTTQVRDELVGNIKRRMTPQPVKIRARKCHTVKSLLITMAAFHLT